MASTLSIHLDDDAKADVRDLLRTHYLEATRILACIEQCKNDRALFKKMLAPKHTDEEERIDFQRWERLHRKGVQVWRLKVLDLERDGKRYRIFYTNTDSKTVWILAIQPRDQVDYDDPNHNLASRIERAVDRLRAASKRPKPVRDKCVPGYVLTITRTK